MIICESQVLTLQALSSGLMISSCTPQGENPYRYTILQMIIPKDNFHNLISDIDWKSFHVIFVLIFGVNKKSNPFQTFF